MAAKSGLSQLSSDHLKLYTSGANADVTFVFPTGEILAHKLILTTRVPYFEKMFASGMKESLTNRVDMPETDKNAFDVFLRYIYGGQLPKDFKVEHQLNFAEMYDVPGLITDCLPKLKEFLIKLPNFDACIDESTRIMKKYVIESARSTFEQELLRRINVVPGVAPTPKPSPITNPTYCYDCEDFLGFQPQCGVCGLCFSCGGGCGGACYEAPEEVPASFIDQLVMLLILSHTEKCDILKKKCFELSTTIKQKDVYKSQFVMAVKKLEQHPDLLGEIVLRFRGITL